MKISCLPNIGMRGVYPEAMAWNIGAVHSNFNLGEQIWRSSRKRANHKVHLEIYPLGRFMAVQVLYKTLSKNMDDRRKKSTPFSSWGELHIFSCACLTRKCTRMYYWLLSPQLMTMFYKQCVPCKDCWTKRWLPTHRTDWIRFIGTTYLYNTCKIISKK